MTPPRDVQAVVGRRIRARREALGWTTYQLAGKVGCSPPAIAQWETGRRNMTVWRLDQVARVLGTTAVELLGGDEAGL